MKPFAESCEENKQPILAVIGPLFAERGRVLEIGSGTGQHAVFFARHMPHLNWQTSELADNHPGIHAWLADEDVENALPPLTLDVLDRPWPIDADSYDAIFSANTVHIMSWPAVEAMFAGIGSVLEAGGLFALYGPFNYGGQYTAESNARFDQWLKARDPQSGVRDFEALDRLAATNGLELVEDYAMPANNRILVWQRIA